MSPSVLFLKREEFPLFGKEGLGEIFEEHVFSIMDSLVIQPFQLIRVLNFPIDKRYQLIP
jgi:hypothetical protein